MTAGRDRVAARAASAGRRLRGVGRALAPRPRDAVDLFAVVVAGALLYHRDLGSYTLRRWDEAIYANAAKHALRDGHWLIPQIRGGLGGVGLHPFLEKPPLALWLQAGSMSVFGVNEFAVRLPSATFAVLTACLVYLLGRDVGDRLTGYLAAIVFLTTPHLYGATNLGRFGGTDTTMLFFGTAGVYLVRRALVRDRPALLVPAGVAGGLAVLAKGFNAGIFALVLLPLGVAYARRVHSKRYRHASGRALVAFALLAIPWHLYALARYGDRFVETYVVEQVLERALTEAPFDRGPTLFPFMDYPYVREFPAWFDPWTYLLVPAVVLAAWTALDDRAWRRDAAVLAWWAAVVFVFFAVTGDHTWYVAPMYVPCSVLVGWLVAAAARRRRGAWLALGAGVVWILVASFHVATTRPAPFGIAPSRGPAFLALLAAGLGAVAAYPALEREYGRAVSSATREVGRAVLPVVVAAAFVVALVGAPPANPWQGDVEQRALANEIEAETPADATVHVDRELRGKPLFPLAFYLDRPLAEVARPDLDDPGVRYAIVGSLPEYLTSRYGLDPPLAAASSWYHLSFGDTSDVEVVLVRKAKSGTDRIED